MVFASQWAGRMLFRIRGTGVRACIGSRPFTSLSLTLQTAACFDSGSQRSAH